MHKASRRQLRRHKPAKLDLKYVIDVDDATDYQYLVAIRRVVAEHFDDILMAARIPRSEIKGAISTLLHRGDRRADARSLLVRVLRAANVALDTYIPAEFHHPIYSCRIKVYNKIHFCVHSLPMLRTVDGKRYRTVPPIIDGKLWPTSLAWPKHAIDRMWCRYYQNAPYNMVHAAINERFYFAAASGGLHRCYIRKAPASNILLRHVGLTHGDYYLLVGYAPLSTSGGFIYPVTILPPGYRGTAEEYCDAPGDWDITAAFESGILSADDMCIIVYPVGDGFERRLVDLQKLFCESPDRTRLQIASGLTVVRRGSQTSVTYQL